MSINSRSVSLVAAAIFAGFVFPAFGDSNTGSESNASDPNYIAAEKAFKAKDWKTVISRLKWVKPDADTYNMIGYAQRNLGNYDDAFKNYNLALKDNPNHRGAHEYVGEAYLLSNNLPMAEQHLAALARICNQTCEEYTDLEREVSKYKTKK